MEILCEKNTVNKTTSLLFGWKCLKLELLCGFEREKFCLPFYAVFFVRLGFFLWFCLVVWSVGWVLVLFCFVFPPQLKWYKFENVYKCREKSTGACWRWQGVRKGKLRCCPEWCQCWWMWEGWEDRFKSRIQAQPDSDDCKQVHPLLPMSLAKARLLCRAPRAVTTADWSGQSV